MTSDSKGFEFSGKAPMGRCILEDRGKSAKLSLWAQDLKTGKPYRIMLILSEMGKFTGAALGSLYVDAKGKGEFKYEFDASTLADGQGISRVCAVAVLAGGVNELISPLVGYKDGPVLWKNHFTSPDSEKKNKVPDTPVVRAINAEAPAVADTAPVSKAVPDTPAVTEAVEVNGISENDKPDPAVSVETHADTEMPVTGPEPEMSDRENEPAVGNDFRFFEKGLWADEYGGEQDFYDSLYNETAYTHQNPPPPEEKPELGAQEPADDETLSSLKEILDNNIEINPFDSKTPGEKWVRISLREPVYLPMDYRYFMNHPFIIAAYKKYNHMILGCMDDEGNYFLGVPGVYEPQHKNALRQLGFTQFKTVKDSEELRQNDYGYWLAPIKVES